MLQISNARVNLRTSQNTTWTARHRFG